MQIRPEQIDPDAAKVVRAAARARSRGVPGRRLRARPPARPQAQGLRRRHQRHARTRSRRLFRNCRIIGRRFRLAHVFFGSKIIETSTFRANPRERTTSRGGERRARGRDLLIRRDNVFGTDDRGRAPPRLHHQRPVLRRRARARSSTTSAASPISSARAGPHDRRSRHPLPRGPGAHPARDQVRGAARLRLSSRRPSGACCARAARSRKCAPPRLLEEIHRLLRGGAARARSSCWSRPASAGRDAARAGGGPAQRSGQPRGQAAQRPLLGVPGGAGSVDRPARHRAVERAGAGGAAVPAPARRPSPRQQCRP